MDEEPGVPQSGPSKTCDRNNAVNRATGADVGRVEAFASSSDQTRIHPGERSHECQCFEEASLAARLVTLTKTNDDDEEGNVDELNYARDHGGEACQDEPSFKCQICGIAFPKSRKLESHTRRIHIEEKRYKCETCGKAYGTSAYRNRHQRTHTEENPYTCEVCHKSCPTAYKLKVHVRTHTGETPYTCEVCHKTFTANSSLKVHGRTHTGEKPYTCQTCLKPFSSGYNLKRHSRTHAI